MNWKNGTSHVRKAFTLIEVLVAVAVIAVLMGLLLPALGRVQRIAKEARQRAQMTSIDIALQTFRNDIGDYPPSGSASDYCGAQKLAEAVVGWDSLGFHPKSVFRSDGLGYDLTNPDNLKERKGPYLALETANAVRLNDIYGAGIIDTSSFAGAGNTFVLGDVFGLVKHKTTGRKIGMPILYYKANTSKSLHDYTLPDSSIYNVNDNDALVALPSAVNGGINPMNAANFYKSTQNPNFVSPARPYRSDSFILISAGMDGLYGTADDIFNFDKD